MAIDVATLRARLVADTAQFERAMGQADRQSVKTGKAMGLARKAAVGIGLGAGAAALAVKSFAQKAGEAEVSQKKMEAQLRASGISYDKHAKAIDTAIQKTAKLAAVDDEDLQDAFTNIVRTTGDVNKSLDLMGLAADLARAKNLDLAKAGDVIAKVAGGNTGILARYGITLKDGANATQALGELQRKFAGQAEAYGKTSAGAQDRFRNAVENLQESLGAGLTPVIAKVTNALATFVDGLRTGTGVGGTVRTLVEKLTDAIRTLLPVIAAATAGFVAYKTALVASLIVTKVTAGIAALETAMLVATAAGGGLTGAMVALNTALRLNPIGLVVTALAALAAAFVVAWQKSETFRSIVVDGFQAIITVIDKVLGAHSTLFSAMSHIPIIGGKFKGVADAIDHAREKLRSFSDGLERLKDKDITIRVHMQYPDGKPATVGPEDRLTPTPQKAYTPAKGNASGGPVRSGEWSWVGERGPELVRFGASGRVFDAGASARMSAGGGVNATFYITSNDSEEAARKVHAALLGLQRRSGSLGFA